MIGSLYSIIITFELRSSISAQDIYAQSQKFSALYGHSSGSKALDNLQQYYMCCGGNSNFKNHAFNLLTCSCASDMFLKRFISFQRSTISYFGSISYYMSAGTGGIKGAIAQNVLKKGNNE